MYRIFSIAIPSDGEEEAELNRFLASHRIVSVRAQWVTSGDVPYEVFTVEYSGVSKVGGNREQSTAFEDKENPSRPDYRKLLTPEQQLQQQHEPEQQQQQLGLSRLLFSRSSRAENENRLNRSPSRTAIFGGQTQNMLCGAGRRDAERHAGRLYRRQSKANDSNRATPAAQVVAAG